jgi:hypothetical protein
MQASAISPVFAATVFRPKHVQRAPDDVRAGHAGYNRQSAVGGTQQDVAGAEQAEKRSEGLRLDLRA